LKLLAFGKGKCSGLGKKEFRKQKKSPDMIGGLLKRFDY